MAVNKCLDSQEGKINFKSYKSILQGLLSLFMMPSTKSQSMPSPLILASSARPGLSPTLIASRIIERQSEAGIPVGPLPSGKTSPAELMERIRAEEYVKAITSEMAVDVALKPGIALTGTGGNAGGPVQIQGFTTQIGTGNGTAR